MLFAPTSQEEHVVTLNRIGTMLKTPGVVLNFVLDYSLIVHNTAQSCRCLQIFQTNMQTFEVFISGYC
jgi:hypothetical protein